VGRVLGGGAAGATCSFSADTVVATKEGKKAIARLKIGDLVLAYNEATKSVGYYDVTAVLVYEDKTLTKLIVNGEYIETTPEHPFYTEEEGWTPAGELETGMHVRQSDGTDGLVWFAWEVSQTETMYNLTVDTAHTFFVGEGQWLVHNACPIRGTAQNPGGPNGQTHANLSESLAGEWSQLPNASSVHMNQTLGTITGGQVPSALRPDVAVVFSDGSVGLAEIVSPSQTFVGQAMKIDQMAELLAQYGTDLLLGVVQ